MKTSELSLSKENLEDIFFAFLFYCHVASFWMSIENTRIICNIGDCEPWLCFRGKGVLVNSQEFGVF